MKLSQRLLAAASLVTPGSRPADIGTDHGYLPIFLVQKGLAPSALAADINTGPLLRAEEHIRREGLEDKIELRLMDGISGLTPEDEIDTIVIAGMGGALTVRILEGGDPAVIARCRELVLAPQSEIGDVREYLSSAGFVITAEEFVFEDGKYYPMMRAQHLPEGEEPRYLRPEEARYGPCLLAGAHPVLRKYLEREKKIQESILAGLPDEKELGDEAALRIAQRRREVLSTLGLNRLALERMEEGKDQSCPRRSEKNCT